jgi:AcrR family transcriptional regulator
MGLVPKILDRDSRRRELAKAVWRVIGRDGVEGASVRAVSAEAGVSAGSLRHFFPSQSDLLAYAMHLVVERVEARVAAAPAAASERQAIEQRLHQLLPLDEARRTENEVWLAFTAQALVRPELRDLWVDVHGALRHACTIAVEALGARDVVFEARRLHAVIDGLAVHAALSQREAEPSRLTATLTRHVDLVEIGGRHHSPASY